MKTPFYYQSGEHRNDAIWADIDYTSQKCEDGLIRVTADILDFYPREPGLVTRYPFCPSREEVHLCWEVCAPTGVIQDAMMSLVCPCDKSGSSDAAPWKMWLEQPEKNRFVWKVATYGENSAERAVGVAPHDQGFRVHLALKAGEFSLSVNDEIVGAYRHADYAQECHFKFGSSSRGQEHAIITTLFRWIQIGGRPLPTPGHTPGPSSDLEEEDWFAGQICPAAHHTHGDIIELKDGRLLLIWTDYTAARDYPDLSGKISQDRGRTWGEKFLVVARQTPRGGLHEPSLLRSRTSGDILLSWYNEEKKNMSMCRSSDEGNTWSSVADLSNSDFGDDIPIVANNDCLLQLDDGRILLACRAYTVRSKDLPLESARQRYPFCMYSDDDGHTWHAGKRMAPFPGGGPQSLNEPGVVELNDGRILMYGRTTLGWVYKTYSDDRGETWGPPAPMPLPSSCSPQKCRRIPATGDLLMVWNNDVEPGEERRSQLYRTPLTAAISRDEGLTWECVKNIEDDPFCFYCYPSLDFVDDRALMTYYNPAWTHVGGGDGFKYINIPLSWCYRDLGRTLPARRGR